VGGWGGGGGGGGGGRERRLSIFTDRDIWPFLVGVLFVWKRCRSGSERMAMMFLVVEITVVVFGLVFVL